MWLLVRPGGGDTRAYPVLRSRVGGVSLFALLVVCVGVGAAIDVVVSMSSVVLPSSVRLSISTLEPSKTFPSPVIERKRKKKKKKKISNGSFSKRLAVKSYNKKISTDNTQARCPAAKKGQQGHQGTTNR